MGLPLLFAHGPRPQTFLQAAAWPRKLFLWASEGDVRDPRAPPSNPREQTQAPACHVKQPPPPSKPYCVGITPALAKQRPQLGSESFFYAAAWPRKLFLWASEGNVRDPRAPPPNPSRQLAGLPPFLQAAAWLRKLFLWASEGNVRDPRAPPPNPSRQLAGVPLLLACPRQRKPQHATLSSHPRLQSPTASASLLHWPNKGRSLAQKAFSMPQLGPESFFYGLPKATLETHGPRPQTLLGSRQACRGLSVACPKPAPSLRPPAPPANVPAGRSLAQKACSMGLPLLFAHGPRPQTFLQAAAWPRKLFLWASEGNVRDPRAPPSNPREQTQAPACHVKQPPPPSKPYCVGITPALAKQRPQLGSESFFYAAAWPRKLFLWASEGNVRDPRAPPPNPSRQLAGLPPFLQAAAWLRKLFLWASEGNVRDPRAPPPNPSRQLAGVPLLLACPRQRKPQQATLSSHPRLQSPTASASLLHWPNKGRSLAQKAFSMPQLGPESFFYGLPKATLETHGPRPQTLLGSRQACRGLSEACPFSSPTGPARKRSCRPQLGPESLFYGPASSLRPRAPPANVPAGRSLAQKAFSMGFRRQR